MDARVEQRLAEIEARCAAATLGPWELRQFGAINGGDVKHGNGNSGTQQIASFLPNDTVGPEERQSNAAKAAHARTDLPAATKLLRALLARDATMHMRGCICVTCDDADAALAEFAKGNA